MEKQGSRGPRPRAGQGAERTGVNEIAEPHCEPHAVLIIHPLFVTFIELLSILAQD